MIYLKTIQVELFHRSNTSRKVDLCGIYELLRSVGQILVHNIINDYLLIHFFSIKM